ncbi:MAG TPA: PEP-CTERM sorting domain-containing protein [Isosphaeraceae bacterium]|jgi:hypothetical protein
MFDPRARLAFGLVAAASLTVMSGYAEADLVYSFKLTNGTGANAYDYHLSVQGINKADLKTGASSVNGQAWDVRPVSEAGATIVFGWTTNSQTPKNPLAANAAGTFDFKVSNENKIKIIRSQWSDTDGSPLGAATAAPTFTVKKADPIFSFSNELEDNIPFGIQNLRFEVNVPELSPSQLDPDNNSPFDPNLPHFLLNQGDAMDFSLPDTLDPGNWDYAFGQVVDTQGHVLGAFIVGTNVPEPASVWMLTGGLLGAVAIRSSRRRSSGNAAPMTLERRRTPGCPQPSVSTGMCPASSNTCVGR